MNCDFLTEVQSTVTKFYEDTKDETLFFHTIDHAREVAERVKELGDYYHLSQEENLILGAAAWFHDIGYLTGGVVGHEYKSAELAGKYLSERLADSNMLMQIQQCILATILPQRPQTLPEQIICDADLYHLGTDDFLRRDGLLRKETEVKTGKIDERKWLSATIDFLESHRFHTEYCRKNLESKRQQNLETLKIMLLKTG